MNELITTIKDWPVIVQGALGSALFWFILLIGQKIATFCASTFNTHNKIRRQRQVRIKLLRLKASLCEEPNEIAFFATAFIYRAAREIVTGLIWLALGLLSDSVIGVFGPIGYLGCIYYSFSALTILKPIVKTETTTQEIQELEKELNELKAENRN
jgi:hypothetical protein